jgi:heme oxygenase (mycobilin-producing)
VSKTNGLVTLINLFEVPPDADDAFVGDWEKAGDYLIQQERLLDSALHRSLIPTAEFRFVNIAHWQSPQAFQAAINKPDFPGTGLPFPAHPSLYRVVREDEGDDPHAPVLINAFEVPAGEDQQFHRRMGEVALLPSGPAGLRRNPASPEPGAGCRVSVRERGPVGEPARLSGGGRGPRLS